MRDALESCPGVKEVEIDFDNQLATAIVDEELADPQKLLQAVKEANPTDPLKFAGTTLK